MPALRPFTNAFCIRILTASLALVVCVFTGCCALPGRCPKESESIAAREQGQLGLQFLHRGKLQEAEVRFEHALENCPEDVRLRHDLAVVRRQQGRTTEAIAEMQKAVGSSGGEPEWLAELAAMQLTAGDLAGAWQSADRAVERQPSLAAAWRVRGDIRKQTGRFDDALRDYHRALAEGENTPELLMQVADVYRVQARPRRVLSTLQRLSDAHPVENHPAQLPYARALAYQALARHDEALPHFELARSAMGDHPDLLTQMAKTQWAVGHRSAARSTLQRASDLVPGNSQIAGLLTEWGQSSEDSPRVAATH